MPDSSDGSSLAQQVAELERAAAEGKLSGRDMAVIEQQVGRAELKLRKALQASPVGKLRTALCGE